MSKGKSPRNDCDRQLRLILRDDTDNLFVRLSPEVARDLKTLASTTNSAVQESGERCWTIHGEDSDFLPLSISILDQTIYASHNGGFLDESDAIELPRSLLSEFSSLPSMVMVQALSSIRHCTRVQVEPVSVEDWELLEVHAQELELGGLLQQVSVVFADQQLSLCLKRDLVQVIVKETSTTEVDSLWPTTEKVSGEPFVLLVQNTEVIVAPKPRPAHDSMEWSTPLRLIPCQEDWNDGMLKLATLANCNPLVVPPGCILVNGASWTSDNEWARIAPEAQEEHSQLVRVKTSPLVPEQQAAIHPWIRLELGLALYWSSICLKPTSPPETMPLENISLQRIGLESSTRSVPSWRRPDVCPSRNAASSSGTHQGNCKWMLPVGSILSASSLLTEPDSKVGEKMFRVESKERNGEPPRLGNEIMLLDQQDRALLWKRHSDDIFSTNQIGDNLEILNKAETDDLANCSPELLVSSTKWIESLLKDVETNKNMLVTICGPTGSGKTYAALVLSAMARLDQHRATLYLDCKRLQESSSSRMVDILAEFDALFEQGVKAKSCLIILDELDRLAPNLLGGDEDDPAARVHSTNPTAVDQSKLISDRILQLIEAAAAACGTSQSDDSGLAIVITCPSVESLNTSLFQSSSLYRRTINVPALSTKERLDVLVQMIERLTSQRGKWDYAALGLRTESFRPRDLEKIASRVQRQICSLHGEMLLENALEVVLKNYVPLSHIYVSRPKTTSGPSWSDIGGLFKVKAKLESTILHPARYRSVYKQASIRLPRGVLLVGPPGCGKSALVPALARACNFPLISCKGPEVLDKYIGASEAKVRELFNRASSVAPSILFLDELDALAPRRGSDHTGVTDRVVNQLLTFLDGVEVSSAATVYVVGATSRPDKVDPALLRPGRLEQHLFVGPPEGDEEWADLLSKIAGGWNLSTACKQSISSKAETKDLLCNVTRNHRFSPADIRAALDTAHVSAVHRALESARAEEIDKIEITKEDLQLALLKTRPSLNADDARVLEEVYKPFRKTGKVTNTDSTGNETRPNSRRLKTTLR